jgi:hypothetical protein
MAGDDGQAIVDALREVQAVLEQQRRDLRELRRSQGALIRELCGELAQVRVEVVRELTEVKSLVRATGAHPAGRGRDRPPLGLAPPPPPTPDWDS